MVDGDIERPDDLDQDMMLCIDAMDRCRTEEELRECVKRIKRDVIYEALGDNAKDLNAVYKECLRAIKLMR